MRTDDANRRCDDAVKELLVDDGPVQLGSMLYTLVEPDPGTFRAYNRWYERDHFYAGVMNLPWNLAGRRWVATKALKHLRYPQPSPIVPQPMDGSFLTTYYIEAGHHGEWDVASVDAVLQLLGPAGRLWPWRRHVITKLFDFEYAVHRDADPVPAPLTLDHHYRGLVTVVGRFHDGVDASAGRAWLRDEFLPSRVRGSAVASVLTFRFRPFEGERPADLVWVPDPPGRFHQLWFLEADPVTIWADTIGPLGAALESAGFATAEWVGGFVPTVPGTDTHVDQL
jgi:hypothetical protein